MANHYVLFGAPGSGKGTQSAKIVHQYGFVHIATGDLLRAQIAAQTPLGNAASALMQQGKLVPDEVVIQLVEQQLQQEPNRTVVFDGFPRTVKQAKVLDELLSTMCMSIARVIFLEVSDDLLKQRVLSRGKTSQRPDDQDEQTIVGRIREYYDKTHQVISYYEAQDKLFRVCGQGEVQEVFDRIAQILG